MRMLLKFLRRIPHIFYSNLNIIIDKHVLQYSVLTEMRKLSIFRNKVFRVFRIHVKQRVREGEESEQ